jgi:uncharacterized protein YndB with AHSA1/START domain/DNA-binding transcriptional ArsR family regulator
MDSVFKALSDETRRHLLDVLRKRDGQTLTELEGGLGMTRFGVMKHLRILEEALLVISRREGRFKYHYLNAAPLQLVVDRWIEPLTQQPLARVMLDLKSQLEGENPVNTITMTRPDFVLETFIRTTPELLWQALTDGDLTKRYYIAGASLHGRIEEGGSYQYRTEGRVMLSGQILAADPLKRLEMSFVPGWLGPDAQPSRNVFEIEAVGDLTRLTILHFDLPEEQEGVKRGWAEIASSLKSWLETGEGLGVIGMREA